jgi:hypothetical protein
MILFPVGPEPPDSPRLRLLAAYYDALHAHLPFQSYLAELFARLAALAESLPSLPPPPPRYAGRADPGLPSSLPEAVQRELHRFCTAWPLPADAPADLWHSYSSWVSGGRRGRPRLTVRPALVGMPTLPELARLGQAPLPLGLLLAGGEEALAALRRAHRLLRAVWAGRLMAAGWREPPRRQPDLALRAERLFRRAVLRQSWRQIAIATGASDLHLVRRQVLADAGLLGIVLPGR